MCIMYFRTETVLLSSRNNGNGCGRRNEKFTGICSSVLRRVYARSGLFAWDHPLERKSDYRGNANRRLGV